MRKLLSLLLIPDLCSRNCYMSTIRLVLFASLVTLAYRRSNYRNTKRMAFALFPTLDLTFQRLLLSCAFCECLKGLAHVDLAKERFFARIFYCFRYEFSVALISALAHLKYASLRLTIIV